MSGSPSGAQLELARRVGVPGLDEELLCTPPVGRGRPDPPLPGQERPGGPPAEAPEDAPATELLRVAVGFLAARLVEAPPAPPVPSPGLRERIGRGIGRTLRRGHRPYVVLGSSLTAEVVRRTLVEAGGVEGGRHPVAVVVGDSLEGLVQGRWTQQVRAGSGRRWRRAWSILEGQASRSSAGLPPGIDLPGLLRDDDGRRETHLLLLPAVSAARAAAGLVGLPLADPGALPPTHDPARVDLLRRIHQALATRLERPARAALAVRLDEWLPAHAVRRLAAPPEHVEWSVELGLRLADRLTEELTGSGVTVHGRAAFVVPSSVVSAPRTVPAAEALDRALAAIRASAEGRA